MASDRETLAALIREHRTPLPPAAEDYPGDEFDCCADSLIAAGVRPPARVIVSRTQLSLMPVGTVVRRTHPDRKSPEVFERQEQGFYAWALASAHGQMSDSDDIFEPGWTVTVLHEPEEGQ